MASDKQVDTADKRLRTDDAASTVLRRKSRTFEKPEGWYFATREGVDVGPFANEELAQQGVLDYAGFAMDAERVYIDSLDVIPDESGLQLDSTEVPQPLAQAASHYVGEVFDRRRGDELAAETRHCRVFESKGGWYFATREGGSIGPFPSFADAERGVADYVSFSLDAETVLEE